MRKLSRKFTMGLILVTSMLLTACTASGNKTKSTNSSQNTAKTVSIGYQSGMPALTILKEQGTLQKELKKEGIKLTWHYFDSTSDMVNATGNSSNGIDFGGGGATASIFGQSANKQIIKVAAQTGALHGSSILTKKDSGINSVKDLKGKKVAVTKGTTQQYLLVEALKKAGLKYSDITPIYMTASDALAAYKKGGQFDAWAVWDPITAQAQASVKSTVVADNYSVFGEKAEHQFASYFFASKSFVKNNPKTVNIILSQLKKSEKWYVNNPEKASKLLAKAYNTDYNSLLVAAKRSGSRRILPVNKNILSGYQDQADVFYNLKVIPRKVNAYDKVFYWDYSK